ncbi:hypothetical protein [Ekhidna sp.]
MRIVGVSLLLGCIKKMTKEEREKANKDQINRFISAYYSEWRFIQILSIQKKLSNKYDFFQDIVDLVRETDNSAGDKTIAQEITNGLLFDAVQHSIQYIEDLFALINASSKKDYFIKNIIQYKAGKVENLIVKFKNENKIIYEHFHFPNYPEEDDHTEQEKETLRVINEGVNRLGLIIAEITEYYKQHQFFYNQYKHGLSIALRPYDDYNQEQVALDKRGEFEKPSIVALDSLNFKNAGKNQYGNTGYLMMPAFSDNVRPHMNTLQKENNLLRYVMSPRDTNIERIAEIASKTKRCLQILLHNFRSIINAEEFYDLRLPAEKETEVIEFKIEIEENTP